MSKTRCRNVDERHRAWEGHSVLGVECQTSRVQGRGSKKNRFFCKKLSLT